MVFGLLRYHLCLAVALGGINGDHVTVIAFWACDGHDDNQTLTGNAF